MTVRQYMLFGMEARGVPKLHREAVLKRSIRPEHFARDGSGLVAETGITI